MKSQPSLWRLAAISNSALDISGNPGAAKVNPNFPRFSVKRASFSQPQKFLWHTKPPASGSCTRRALITRPVVYELGKNSRVITNVRQASVTPEVGIVSLGARRRARPDQIRHRLARRVGRESRAGGDQHDRGVALIHDIDYRGRQCPSPATLAEITPLIVTISDQRVILDADLAALYGVSRRWS